MVGVSLIHRAGVAAAADEPLRAACFLGAAEALLAATAGALWPGDERRRRAVAAAVRRVLGDATGAAAQSQGSLWSLDTAVAYAVDPDLPLPALGGKVHPVPATNSTGRAAPSAPAARNSQRAALTKRELIVARLVTQGLTNREIAARLVITERTAASHLEHILAKLGVRSRTQIAAWATRYGVGAAVD